MAEVVNLRLARKAKRRGEAAAIAAVNRAKFGRSEAEKAVTKAEVVRLDRGLDGTKRAD